MSCGSAGDYQSDEQAGVELHIWRLSNRRAGRCRTAQLVIIKQMSRQVSRGSAGDYQADERAGFVWLSWRLSRRRAGRYRGAQLAIIKQMSRQVSRGSGGEYQADEQRDTCLFICLIFAR